MVAQILLLCGFRWPLSPLRLRVSGVPGEDAKKEKTSTRNAFLYQLFSWPQVMTSSGLGKNTKICCLIGQHGAKLAAEDSAVEAYLLVGAVLKPEVDRRQLTIYVPPCKNPEPNFSAVLWLLGRWAEPSHKPKEARAFKKLFSFPQNTVTGEAGSHARDITGVVWANFFPSSVFLLLETRGSPALPGTGEGRGGCDAAAHPSWVMRLRRGAWMPSVSLSAYARSRFSPCCSLSTSPSFSVGRRAAARLCWPWGDVRRAAYTAEVCVSSFSFLLIKPQHMPGTVHLSQYVCACANESASLFSKWGIPVRGDTLFGTWQPGVWRRACDKPPSCSVTHWFHTARRRLPGSGSGRLCDPACRYLFKQIKNAVVRMYQKSGMYGMCQIFNFQCKVNLVAQNDFLVFQYKYLNILKSRCIYLRSKKSKWVLVLSND